MSEQELSKAIKKLDSLKFYPRDDLKNQQLVLFCERMVGEVSPFHREELEMALDNFEHAMASGDREIFQESRQMLLITLSQLGIDYQEEAE